MVKNQLSKILRSLIPLLILQCTTVHFSTALPYSQIGKVNSINCSGYYYATYSGKGNSMFSTEHLILVKFDDDGFCNYFDLPILIGQTVDSAIDNCLQRIVNIENSGFYFKRNDFIVVKYFYLESNQYHFFSIGANYYPIEKSLWLEGKNLYIHKDENNTKLYLKFVANEHIRYNNYLRNHKSIFWK